MTILIEETLKRLESTPGMVEAIQAFGIPQEFFVSQALMTIALETLEEQAKKDTDQLIEDFNKYKIAHPDEYSHPVASQYFKQFEDVINDLSILIAKAEEELVHTPLSGLSAEDIELLRRGTMQSVYLSVYGIRQQLQQLTKGNFEAVVNNAPKIILPA